MTELKEWLEGKGFKIYDNNPLKSKYNEVTWYAAKLTSSKRECTSNKKPVQIVVNPYTTTMRHGIHESITVDITAEWAGIWWKLEAYSIPPREFKKKLAQIEKQLVNAWEAL
jgi:hypothetical protein